MSSSQLTPEEKAKAIKEVKRELREETLRKIVQEVFDDKIAEQKKFVSDTVNDLDEKLTNMVGKITHLAAKVINLDKAFNTFTSKADDDNEEHNDDDDDEEDNDSDSNDEGNWSLDEVMNELKSLKNLVKSSDASTGLEAVQQTLANMNLSTPPSSSRKAKVSMVEAAPKTYQSWLSHVVKNGEYNEWEESMEKAELKKFNDWLTLMKDDKETFSTVQKTVKEYKKQLQAYYATTINKFSDADNELKQRIVSEAKTKKQKKIYYHAESSSNNE